MEPVARITHTQGSYPVLVEPGLLVDRGTPVLHLDPLGFLGSTGSFIAFSLAVFASFISSAAGFYLIRKAADQTL